MKRARVAGTTTTGFACDVRQEEAACVFDRTLAEALQYTRGGTKRPIVNCIMTLLTHVRDAFGFRGVFAFHAREGLRTPEVIYATAPHINKRSVHRVLGQLSESVHRQLLLPTGSVQYVSREQMEREHNGVANVFSTCFVARTRTLPLPINTMPSVVVFLFDCNPRIDTYFVSTWLEVLFTFWSDAFLAAMQQFNSRLEAFRKSPTQNLEIFDEATIVQPWLSSADLCQMCELGLGAVGEDRSPEVASKINAFAAEWHACIDRGWPCDTGQAFAVSRPGILSWYLWLAGGSTEKAHLKSGVEYCRKALAALAARNPEDEQVDDKLDRVVLGALLRDVSKLVPLDKHTDSYRHAKEHITRLVVATFAGMPYTAKTIEAIIWMLSEYAYNIL
jgi:hypothetical protein